MKRFLLLFATTIILCIPCAVFNTAQAQEATQIRVLESGDKNATFTVSVTSSNDDEMAAQAMGLLFHALLEQGVDGVHGGKPLMNVDNPKWKDNFFKSKNPPYMAYVKGYHTEGVPVKNSVGDYQVTVIVRLNIEFLLRQLKAYGVLK